MFHTFSTQVASTFNSRRRKFPWQGGIHDKFGLDLIVLASKEIWDNKTLVGLGNALGNFAKTFEAMKQVRYISHICICVYMLLVWKFKFSQFNQGKIKLIIYCYIFSTPSQQERDYQPPLSWTYGTWTSLLTNILSKCQHIVLCRNVV